MRFAVSLWCLTIAFAGSRTQHSEEGEFHMDARRLLPATRYSGSGSSSGGWSKSATAASSTSTATASASGPPCTITSCEGIDLLAAIRADLEPWRTRGGIRLADTDAAQKKGCAFGEEDGHFFGCVPGWVRVMVVNNTLWATHMGEGFGTRDGVFLVAMLELLARYGKQVPDVDFVLQPGDRAKLAKVKNPLSTKVLPLMLSFAVNPDFLEVGIPDPSFWSWPEMGVRPHWELVKDPDVLPWPKKAPTAFWRGGSNRRFGGAIRKRLLQCAAEAPTEGLKARLDVHDAMRLAAIKNASKPKVCKSACLEWVGPMAMCKHKLALFVQGEGYTSSKQRVLACGSLPVFLSHDKMDSYYSRWLVENKHFKSIASGQDTICNDLKKIVWWAAENDAAAEKIGVAARRFSTRVLGEEMVHQYLLHMLKEVAALQRYHVSEAWRSVTEMQRKAAQLPAVQAAARHAFAGLQTAHTGLTAIDAAGSGTLTKLTPQTIAAWFRAKEPRKGAMIEVALASTLAASKAAPKALGMPGADAGGPRGHLSGASPDGFATGRHRGHGLTLSTVGRGPPS